MGELTHQAMQQAVGKTVASVQVVTNVPENKAQQTETATIWFSDGSRLELMTALNSQSGDGHQKTSAQLMCFFKDTGEE